MRREMTTSEAQLLLFAICNEYDLQKRRGGAESGGPGDVTAHSGKDSLVGHVPSVTDDSGLGDEERTVLDGNVAGRTKTKVCSIS
jgi:hypothetical protein